VKFIRPLLEWNRFDRRSDWSDLTSQELSITQESNNDTGFSVTLIVTGLDKCASSLRSTVGDVFERLGPDSNYVCWSSIYLSLSDFDLTAMDPRGSVFLHEQRKWT